MTEQNEFTIIRQRKSQAMGCVLTLLFGPLGLLYASPIGSLLMVILAVALGLVTFGLGAILVWPASIIWSIVAIYFSNASPPKTDASTR